ncbi:putative receptor-type tyrosine-protein phosphatase kappa [Apostichopus japonicus]|uniref:protein-tyrosine-phosphatase n=1 Tax=Stichopus japonicus TaxID=307972 RepID=A0A2G8L2V7_STIJA|nr:putative receptor-type tyrosine-protein phosphatase kappa [Apostichopus japonicus]
MPNETDSAYHGLSNLDRRLLTHTVPRREAGFDDQKLSFGCCRLPSGLPLRLHARQQRLALTKVPSVLRALKWYLNRTQDLLGTSTSLFFLLRVPHSAAWEDTLSRCLVEAIRPLATGPGRSMAHNSRGFTASTALFAGFPIVDICKTTAWKTPIASSPATYRTYHRPIWLCSGVHPSGPLPPSDSATRCIGCGETECQAGFFGDNCREECRCDSDACDRVTGECVGCCKHHAWIDSPPSRCQEGPFPRYITEIINVTVNKTNPGTQWSVTCWVEEIQQSSPKYTVVLSQTMELSNTSLEATSFLTEASNRAGFIQRGSIFTTTDAKAGDTYYCVIPHSTGFAWLNTTLSHYESSQLLQYTQTNLEEDIIYAFSVSTVRAGDMGEGPMGPPVTVKTLCEVQSTPKAVMATVTDLNQLNVTWQVVDNDITCSTGITGYTIYYKVDGSSDDPQRVTTVSGSTMYTIIEGLEPGENYIFMVSLTTDQESPLSEASMAVTVPEKMPGPTPIIALFVIIPLAVLLIIILLVGFILYRRKTSKPPQPRFTPSYSNPVSTNDEAVKPNPGNNTYEVPDIVQLEPKNGTTSPPSNSPQVTTLNESEDPPISPSDETYTNLPLSILVSDLEEYYRRNKQNLVQEFQLLRKGQQFPWTVGDKEGNRKKNRFRKMFTYDHSRVVLEKLMEEPDSDYYNASYILDQRGETSLIASQAPNKASLNDFWRLIWQEKVSTIVMLTNLTEYGKDRCTQYWPNQEGGSKSFGHIVVSWATTVHFADFDVKELHVVNENKMQTVYQLHYTTWPDMDVPTDFIPITELIKHTKLLHNHKKSPVLIHCSAGVGRTGTFISIYCLMEVIKTEREINVFSFVETARKNRINMVQTEKQYNFIYESLVDFYLTSHTEIPVQNLESQLNAKHALTREFDLLNRVVIRGKTRHIDGVDNSQKIRFKETEPNDKGSIFLSSETSSGYSNYINATGYRSLKKRTAFITTQSPLPNTVEDFWCLIQDWECPVIVMLNKLDLEDKTCAQYWPDEGATQYGFTTVSLLNGIKHPHFVHREFEVSHAKSKKVMSVHQLQLLNWPEDRNFSVMKEFRKKISFLYKQQEMCGPMLVHCISGVGRSSVFVAMDMALQQIEANGTVDVFNVVRQMRNRNPNVIKSEEDYFLCYQIIQSVASKEENYENLKY